MCVYIMCKHNTYKKLYIEYNNIHHNKTTTNNVYTITSNLICANTLAY